MIIRWVPQYVNCLPMPEPDPRRPPSSRTDAISAERRALGRRTPGKDGIDLRRLSMSCGATASKSARTRCLHVIPDPHPSSCGSICQGMPLRRTNRMPVRHARSETRGRPPFVRRGGVGRNGSTRSHNGFGSSAAAIRLHATSPTKVRLRRFCYAL